MSVNHLSVVGARTIVFDVPLIARTIVSVIPLGVPLAFRKQNRILRNEICCGNVLSIFSFRHNYYKKTQVIES